MLYGMGCLYVLQINGKASILFVKYLNRWKISAGGFESFSKTCYSKGKCNYGRVKGEKGSTIHFLANAISSIQKLSSDLCN